MIALLADIAETYNYVEATIWSLFSAGCLIAAVKARRPVRSRWLAAAVLFLAFGISDLVETRTGAWWRPWWLLLWKAACLLGLAALAFEARRRRHRG